MQNYRTVPKKQKKTIFQSNYGQTHPQMSDFSNQNEQKCSTVPKKPMFLCKTIELY